MRFDRCNDIFRDFILHREDVVQIAIIFICPNMTTILGLYKLTSNPQAIPTFRTLPSRT